MKYQNSVCLSFLIPDGLPLLLAIMDVLIVIVEVLVLLLFSYLLFWANEKWDLFNYIPPYLSIKQACPHHSWVKIICKLFGRLQDVQRVSAEWHMVANTYLQILADFAEYLADNANNLDYLQIVYLQLIVTSFQISSYCELTFTDYYR